MTIRIRNLWGTDEYDHKTPKDLKLDYPSWIRYYRAVTGITAEIKCIVHNCIDTAFHCAYVEAYESNDNNRTYKWICNSIVPLCRKHIAQKYKMRSGVNDIPFTKNSLDSYLVSIKNNILMIPRPCEF